MGQLPLALALAHHARFETFVAGANSAAVRHVRALAAGSSATVWLWGAAGSGKTHLLQAACHAAAVAGKRAMYVPLGGEQPLEPAVLTGLGSVELLALDDIDRVAGEPLWEQPLFMVLDEFLGRDGGLLLAAHAAAGATAFRLADLASRAAGAVSYRLQPLDDGDRMRALLAHAAARGLDLDRPAAEYLLQRVDRDMVALRRWLDKLDRASLVEQRKLTIPFIRGLLASRPASGE